ncbi:MAG: hypothetical protein LBR21_06095, partial [Propionibacteriaceae bacterium]|nr:hypothetical protein [Propionibacteriaceae bacterium]
MSDNPYDPNDPSTTPPASDQQEPTAPIPQYGSDNSAYGSTPQYPTSDNSGQPRYGSYENSGPIPPVTPPQMPMGGQVPPG